MMCTFIIILNVHIVNVCMQYKQDKINIHQNNYEATPQNRWIFQQNLNFVTIKASKSKVQMDEFGNSHSSFTVLTIENKNKNV